jgi:mannose-6-phosphate isomerase-like protein (cupin superfamily)
MSSHVSAPRTIAAGLKKQWSPRVIAEVGDTYIKVAKLEGSLVWHAHPNEDELFYVLKGSLRIEMESETVTLDEGQMFVVGKGVKHNPVADEECLVLFIEPKSLAHTGDVVTDRTRSIEEQLRG